MQVAVWLQSWVCFTCEQSQMNQPLLYLQSDRLSSMDSPDQTPTPTRFLKNCEEVGLFNELASPFENEFKKASEDDIKKMPLDLSPLATPIIRNKIEEPSVVETTHQDSPLPHPESTTNDEKVRTFIFLFLELIFGVFLAIVKRIKLGKSLSEGKFEVWQYQGFPEKKGFGYSKAFLGFQKQQMQEVSLQQPAQPTSTIVRPASLQVPNVLLTSSDSSVIIQQAIPSPTSSTVITQAPSSNRPIVPVPGPFPLLLHLPNGQTMPVAIPASITNSNVHVPAAVPLVRPVTMVPSIPGIPGPSSPQPVQSEAKLLYFPLVLGGSPEGYQPQELEDRDGEQNEASVIKGEMGSNLIQHLDTLKIMGLDGIPRKSQKEDPGNYRPFILTCVGEDHRADDLELCHVGIYRTARVSDPASMDLWKAGPASLACLASGTRVTYLVDEEKTVSVVCLGFTKAFDTVTAFS
ncbi:hypothetical protein WISP_77330 [Willisornis vidua]|uniref:Uncharacterized protein n=1 Tax=Willisornis vidua TaxID=1566151 RepID=A0ABQ9DBH2_9PASS|nr:hypothetical protein WISP_77330 [Willisornis vidua]